jgi:beta-lactamase class C
MDMLYHLPFRDWMELNRSSAQSIAAVDTDASDSSDGQH